MFYEVNTPEFLAVRAKIDALLLQRNEVAANIRALIDSQVKELIAKTDKLELNEALELELELELQHDKELQPLREQMKAIQAQISDLAASVWVSYKKTPADLVKHENRLL